MRGMPSNAASGYRIRGPLLIDSDIPFGAGLSSSAALEISVGLALASMGDKTIDMVDLAFAGQEVEHNYLGVRSGIMDQFASALGKAGNALFIDCRSLAFEHIPVDLSDLTLIVCDSKVEHELAATEYNTRREQCEEGVKILQADFPTARALRDISGDDFHRVEKTLPDVLRRRCRHVITENARTLQSTKALEEGDMQHLGELMYQSHQSLRKDYEVSCDELDLLVEAAAEVAGVLGARMTGGGFGGCTINLLGRERGANFTSHVQSDIERLSDVTPKSSR